jgi:hypothetical protein
MSCFWLEACSIIEKAPHWNHARPEGVQLFMRYWAWLAIKLTAGAALLLGIDQLIHAWFPRPGAFLYAHPEPFAHDLAYTTVMMVFFLLCFGVLHLIIWDQRTRCRTCLRRLRMPVNAGSWSNMLLFGQPRTEYICVYGHGTLRIPEVELTGPKRPDWKANDDDIWKELESLESSEK